MWTIELFKDPLGSQGFQPSLSHHSRHNAQASSPPSSSFVVSATVPIEALLGSGSSVLSVFLEGGRTSRVALADFASRHFLACHGRQETEIQVDEECDVHGDGRRTRRRLTVRLESLDRALLRSRRRMGKGAWSFPPYVVERSDFWCDDKKLHVTLRGIFTAELSAATSESSQPGQNIVLNSACKSILSNIFGAAEVVFREDLLRQTACMVLQERLRSTLCSVNAVAFVCDGSILPRKSSSSDAPMASPPAVPFKAPAESSMSQSIKVDMGSLAKYLPSAISATGDSTVTLNGLLVLEGVTLICGGGYHGKSTLLQTIAVGVYDKIPGDGREYCVTVRDAVTVRAEDGRYVNNCNISAFIANLPTPPGVEKALDTQHFSSRDSSGSTSQAANVVEAIEMGATAMLVDEDISAANFMARDGRMRALVMDESITPLLYRVNGLYNTHQISSVVVVGGVGDWLDVPHNVILLDKYVASDATKKARSISYQFSYGHVQYGGRGVVHRLEWLRTGTPFPRRPVDSFSKRYDIDVVVSLLDGGHALSLHQEENGSSSSIDDCNTLVVDDDEDGCIDASRLEQLLGRRQLYGCGLCVAWLLQFAPKHPQLGLKELLQRLDTTLDNGGIQKVVTDLKETNNNGSAFTTMAWSHLLESTGFAERPRKFEIGQAITRVHGIQMEEIPVEIDEADEAERLKEERRKQALADLWAQRRAKPT